MKRRFSKARTWICVSMASLVLAGCIQVPKNAIRLSDIQIKHLEEYQESVASIVESHRADARALIVERDRQYGRLLARGEAFRKELYRLASHLLTREPVLEGDADRYSWEELTSADQETILKLESHVNRRIRRYKAAVSFKRIDPEEIIRLKQENRGDDLQRILNELPDSLASLKRDILNLLLHESFEDARAILIRRINTLNENLAQDNSDIVNLGRDLNTLVVTIAELEGSLDGIRQEREAYNQRANEILKALEDKFQELESAGETVLETQRDLHGALRGLGAIEAEPKEIILTVSSLIDSLGRDGIIEDSETARRLNELVAGVAGLF